MPCYTCSKNQKTATNNQWASNIPNNRPYDSEKYKSEFSNEWVSTNKMITSVEIDE